MNKLKIGIIIAAAYAVIISAVILFGGEPQPHVVEPTPILHKYLFILGSLVLCAGLLLYHKKKLEKQEQAEAEEQEAAVAVVAVEAKEKAGTQPNV